MTLRTVPCLCVCVPIDGPAPGQAEGHSAGSAVTSWLPWETALKSPHVARQSLPTRTPLHFRGSLELLERQQVCAPTSSDWNHCNVSRGVGCTSPSQWVPGVGCTCPSQWVPGLGCTSPSRWVPKVGCTSPSWRVPRAEGPPRLRQQAPRLRAVAAPAVGGEEGGTFLQCQPQSATPFTCEPGSRLTDSPKAPS